MNITLNIYDINLYAIVTIHAIVEKLKKNI